jgi:hypothetical protein
MCPFQLSYTLVSMLYYQQLPEYRWDHQVVPGKSPRRLSGSMALLLRARSILAVSVIASPLLSSLTPTERVLASDRGPSAQTRMATPLSKRRETPYGNTGLLAQSTPLTVPSQSCGEEVLAMFDAAAPKTVEEEVAKAYGLELSSRLTLESFGKRMVRFCIPDARSVTDVIAVLRADDRVSSAQRNFRYYLPDQSPVAISSLKEHPPTKAIHEKRLASAQHQGGAKTTIKTPAFRRAGPLLAGNHTLRFPSADEPFVNVGGRNR